MGWLRRKVPEDLYYGQEEKEKPPYLSLSDDRVHYRDLEERRKKEVQKGVLDFKLERAEIDEMEREMYRFISDPSLIDQVEIRSLESGNDRRNAAIFILCSFFIMFLLLFMIGITLLISVSLSLLTTAGMGVLYHFLKEHHNEELKKKREDAILGIGPSPSNWVVLENREMEICFSKESDIIAIHYLDIESVSDREIDQFHGHKARHNERIRLAPDPWKIKGALYPPNTPIDDLVVIGLAKELDLPSFIYPWGRRQMMSTPHMGIRRKTGRIIIAVRSDEKERFLGELRSRLKRRKELEKDGYMDEWG